MTVAAELVARLAQEGIDPNLLAQVAQELFAGEIERKALADRRQNDRDRKAGQRAKSRDVTGQARKSATPPPNEYISNPPPASPTKPIGLEPKPKKHRLPVDWEPRPFKSGSLAALTIIRWEPGRMERELSKFRDHHTAAGSRFEDWQAAWSKWVNNSDDFRGQSGGRQQQQPGSSRNLQGVSLAFGEPSTWSDDRPF